MARLGREFHDCECTVSGIVLSPGRRLLASQHGDRRRPGSCVEATTEIGEEGMLMKSSHDAVAPHADSCPVAARDPGRAGGDCPAQG